jgi:hypothetical protein
MRSLVAGHLVIVALGSTVVASTLLFANQFTRVVGTLLPPAADAGGQFDLPTPSDPPPVHAPPSTLQPGVVNCAMLQYGGNDAYVCYSSEFLAQITRDSHIRANDRLVPIRVESRELFQFPFAVLTGEGEFILTESQRRNLRDYLESGGFIIASAGCSSDPWRNSFTREIGQIFPEVSLTPLDQTHPAFHTVYDIEELQCKGSHRAHLEGLELDGKIALIFSPDGLNDTSKVGGKCCCCGGNEIKNARQVNVNLLAYALTH